MVQNIKTFPADYDSSQNAWMTSVIWTKLLQNWNLQLCKENRKVVQLVGKCSAHIHVPSEEIRLIFLSLNTTSLIQPCDIGIIRALKHMGATKSAVE